MIMVMIGTVVVMTEASIGEVSDTPAMKQPWLSVMPNREAKKSMARSWGGTCSLRANAEAIQKSTEAPNIRKVVSASGVMAPDSSTALEIGDMMPHRKLAPNMAKWPIDWFSFMTVVRIVCME